MGCDYYAEAKQIASKLANEGLLAEAQALQDVIAAGATATEILMGVRWQLRESRAASKTKDSSTRRSIEKLLATLDLELS